MHEARVHIGLTPSLLRLLREVDVMEAVFFFFVARLQRLAETPLKTFAVPC